MILRSSVRRIRNQPELCVFFATLSLFTNRTNRRTLHSKTSINASAHRTYKLSHYLMYSSTLLLLARQSFLFLFFPLFIIPNSKLPLLSFPSFNFSFFSLTAFSSPFTLTFQLNKKRPDTPCQFVRHLNLEPLGSIVWKKGHGPRRWELLVRRILSVFLLEVTLK